MTISLQTDARFQARSCSFCRSDDRRLIFDLKAEQFCSVNWTYSNNYPDVLQISKDEKFPVDQCGACGFVYARLLPSSNFLSRVYEDVIDPEECRKGSENLESYTRRMAYIADLLALTPDTGPLRALDFGCGLGVGLRILNAVGVKSVGYDPSPIRSETSRVAGSTVVNGESDLRDLAPYDILICDNVLEHIPEPSKTLELLSSVCASGAVLYVSVPSYESDFISLQLNSLKEGLPLDMTLNPWEHLNYFDLDHLDRLVSRYGFEPIPTCELPGHVNIGLRPESLLLRRLKNSLASLLRLAHYAVLGHTSRSVNNAFYRFTGAV